jgi:hypothetical protein
MDAMDGMDVAANVASVVTDRPLAHRPQREPATSAGDACLRPERGAVSVALFERKFID